MFGYSNIYESGANDNVDNVLYTIAFKTYLSIAGFNTIAQTSTKVPQTDAGLILVKSRIIDVCGQFVNFGFIAPGIWNSSDTIGNPVTFKEQIALVGYYCYYTPLSQQTQADRANRIANFQLAIKLAGGIGFIIINGIVEK
jgi:hypothetical protein